MSKQGQVAKALTPIEAPQSDTRELAPQEGTPQVEEVRDRVQTLTEVTETSELPSFEEAYARIQSIQQGDNMGADKLSHELGSKKVKYVKRIPESPKGGLGWCCRGREDGPLSLEQSLILAGAINDKIDEAKMNEEAAQKKAKKEKENNAGEEADSYSELLEIAEKVQTLNDLTEVVAHCRTHKLLEVSGGRTDWQTKGLEGNEQSQKLAQAINAKKNALLKEIRVTRARIDAVLKQIEYCPSSEQLDKDVWDLHQRKRLIKEFTGPNSSDWIAYPIKGLQGSKEVCDALNKRREELVKMEEEEKKRKESEARQNLLKKFKR